MRPIPLLEMGRKIHVDKLGRLVDTLKNTKPKASTKS
jgi:hypothetical protein